MNDLNVSARALASLAILLALAIASVAAPLQASSAPGEAPSSKPPWTQWRGPDRDGSVGGSDWPDTLEGLDRSWRIELGEGYSGPIVYGDSVFVVESVDNKSERVRALDRESGREIWRTSWPGSGSVPFFAKRSGEWIRSTPAHDGEALYVGGMEEVLVKLDAETGEEVWRIDFPARFETEIPDFGFASSPILANGALYVQAANSIVKIDPATGNTVWRALESSGKMMDSGAFSSPILAEIADTRQLVVQTRSTLYGLDPNTGEMLWSHGVPNYRGMNILTPVVFEDGVLTSPYRNRTFLYRISPTEGGFDAREAWSSKVHGYMSSPVVIAGHAYLHLGNGRLACIDLETGAERWISKPFGDYWSLVTQGDKILALDASGELHLLRANPEQLETLGSKEIARQPTWGHLAVSGNDLFVRELNAIAAYRWHGAASKEAGP